MSKAYSGTDYTGVVGRGR